MSGPPSFKTAVEMPSGPAWYDSFSLAISLVINERLNCTSLMFEDVTAGK